MSAAERKSATPDRSGEAKAPVVLLHGLLRRPGSMETPARWLRRHGYEAHNLAYPSRRKSIDDLAKVVNAEIERRFSGDPRRVHFLTHSLGGIVLRQILADREADDTGSWKLGRVVMLAPPNRGSLLADAIGDWRLFRLLFKTAGQELRAGASCQVADLPAPPQLGIIAGTRSIGTYRRALKGRPEAAWPNDGTVAVNEAQLNDAPVVTVAAMHAFIMNSREALENADRFFRRGRFN